ncbi:hypothetical protein ACEWY4_013322 [Coilia grayii]|uniref:G-protein coupled receptors family 1 profile domain-containing protein n=1 Tax=Coilia grayii TaxID=363190 RepID=A0ABD1JW04_9TELE
MLLSLLTHQKTSTPELPGEIQLAYTILEVLLAVACCLGNLLVIWAVWTCGAVRRQPTFCFIVSLAAADFLVGAVLVPLRILGDDRIQLSFHGCVAFCSVVIVLTQTSIFSQLAIAVDRFLRVAIPLRGNSFFVCSCLHTPDQQTLTLPTEEKAASYQVDRCTVDDRSTRMAYNIAEVIYTYLEILLAVACCLGNLLVIWAVWSCGVTKQQPTFCCVVSLAVADVLVGAVAIPLRLLSDSRAQMPFYGCLTCCCWVIFLTQVSVFSQLTLACDRFLRVIIPLRYKTTVTPRRCWWVVAACWLMAALVGFTPLMGWNNRANLPHTNRTDCQFLNVMSMSYLVNFNLYTCFLGPMVIMIVLYCGIFALIRRQLRSPTIGMSQSYFQKERKLTMSLVMVLVLFAVAWLPIQLMNMVTYYWGLSTVPREAFYVGILLSQASSAVNPVIYALKIRHIRNACKSVWRRVILCRDEEETSRTPGTDSSSNTKRHRCDEMKTVETPLPNQL